MGRRRIEFDVNDADETVSRTRLVLGCEGSPWSGFLLENHCIAEKGGFTHVAPRHPLVVVSVAGNSSVRFRLGRKWHDVHLDPGRCSYICRGCELQSLSWSGTQDLLFIEIRHSRIKRFWQGGEQPLGLARASEFAVYDRQISALAGNMRAEIAAGCPSGRLYAESLSIALAAYLSGRFGAGPGIPAGRRPTLSTSQLRRVRKYVHAHLSDELSLVELANVARLSAHYFSRLFKNTVGTTPHRYVLVERVEESKRLLAKGQLPIKDVATALGFASQSHFTDVFRKATGTTPAHYRLHH